VEAKKTNVLELSCFLEKSEEFIAVVVTEVSILDFD
jgi:hypothetical protein